MKKHFNWVVLAIGLIAACAGNPATKSVMGAIGGGCYSDDDCFSGLFCDTAAPGGQCLKKCKNTADCGQGAVCNSEKKCYQACQNSADCKRYGYACKSDGPTMFCDVVDGRRAELNF